MPIEKKWHVVYTCPNAEKKLHQRLLEKGIETFLPLQKVVRFWSDRRKTMEVPLFTSYVFVKVNNQSIPQVMYSKGFASFVSFSGQFATIPDEQIEAIELIASGTMPFEVKPHDYAKGDPVRINAGPLKGYQCIVERSRGKHQVIIKVDHIGYSLAVEMDKRSLTALPVTSRPVKKRFLSTNI